MEIGAKPADIFGAPADVFGSPTPDAIFTAANGASELQQTAQLTISAQKREINRIKGYKEQLTPAENAQLAKIQKQIQEIEKKASDGTVRADELEDRRDLYKQADEIIGKPSIDIEADEVLVKLGETLNELLGAKLNPRERRRVETLERVKDGLEERFASNPSSATVRRQIQSLTAQIAKLAPLRSVSQLSVPERKAYDEITELINDHAGVKVQLPSRDALRVAELEKSIIQLQESLPADASQQPTSGQVARAYTRLG